MMHSYSKKRIIAAGIVLLAALCAASAKSKKKNPAPQWLTMPAAVYSTSQYFTGVGSGAAREEAGLEAVKNVASIFGQDITAVTKASKRMEQAQKEGKVATASSSTLGQSITNQVNQDDIIGIEIPEYYQDDSRKWYAIAILDKPKVSKIYVSMIKKNKTEISALVDDAESLGASLEAYSNLSFALEIASVNDGYIERLSVIDSAAADEVAKDVVTAKIIRTRMTALAREIPICVKIEGDKNSRLAAAFGKCFAKFGFKTSEDPNERYAVIGRFTFENDVMGKNFFSIYSLDSSLTDTFNGEALFPINFQGREGSTTEIDANNRAYRVIEKKVATEFDKTIADYLTKVRN